MMRVQLSRKKGWRMPPNTERVARPSKWGNPFTVVEDGNWWCMLDKDNGIPFFSRDGAARQAVILFRERLPRSPLAKALGELRGKNLACWCPLDQPCHADVLLELANQ